MYRFLSFSSLFLLFILAINNSNAASFDCSKAQEPDEKAICSDETLSGYDDELARIYKGLTILQSGDELKKLQESQRQWLKERAQCASDATCLNTVYANREDTLNNSFTPDQKTVERDLFRKFALCSGCDLRNENFSQIVPSFTADSGLQACTVDGSVQNSQLDGANLAHADFTLCASKHDSALNSMTWDGSSLKNVNFTGAILGFSSMQNVDLTGANLKKADLSQVDMENSDLTNARLDEASSIPGNMSGGCSTFKKVNFIKASFIRADLCGDFRGADFSGADLKHAKLHGYVVRAKDDPDSDMVGLDMVDPLPHDFRFGGKINLTDANLAGATIFTEKALEPGGYAFAILCNTTMPDGKLSNRDCKK